jgi:hypothetical protein
LSPNIWTVPSFKGLITSLYIVILSYMLVSRHDHILYLLVQVRYRMNSHSPNPVAQQLHHFCLQYTTYR